MAGRPRKPTAAKKLKGTLQPCRTNPNEPLPPKGRPLPPKHLSAKAKKIWPYVSGMLERMGVLTEADGLALEGLCEAYADLREARESLAKPLMFGEMVLAEPNARYFIVQGAVAPMVKVRPEHALIADADRRMKGWAERLGMTPADRSRVSGSKPAEENEFEGF